jgi:hypothetical protein
LELRIEENLQENVVEIEATVKNLQPVKEFGEGRVYFIDDNPRYYNEHEFAVVGSNLDQSRKSLCVYNELKKSWKLMIADNE